MTRLEQQKRLAEQRQAREDRRAEREYEEAQMRVLKTVSVFIGGASLMLAVLAGTAHMTEVSVTMGVVTTCATLFGLL